MQGENVKKEENTCASRRKLGIRASPSDRSHRFRGEAGFELIELFIVVAIMFIGGTFIASLSHQAIVLIAFGAFIVVIGWYKFESSISGDRGLLRSLMRLPFSLAIMALGCWMVFRGLTV